MALTPIEIIALVFAVLALVKIAVIIFSGPKKWMDTVKPIYDNSKTSSLVFTLLALLVFWYLIQALTIVQIFAVFFAIALVYDLFLLRYVDSLMKDMRKLMKGLSTLTFLLWLVLAAGSVWVLFEVFA